MNITELLNYQFIQNAYLAGTFIALLCAVLGLILVLKKLSLIGDGLAHVSFGAIALGLFFGFYPFYIAIPVVILASYLIWHLEKRSKLYGDAAIGIVSAVGIASGVILASISRGFNIDLFSYLFGNILAISQTEVLLSIILSLIALTIIIIFYRNLFITTFDEEYAKTRGIKTDKINLILMTLTAITVVLAIKVVGIMLVSALLIIPAASSLQIAKGFKSAIIIAGINAVFSVLIGITVSFYLDIPAGATIVIINFIIFIFMFLGKKI